MDWTSSHGRLLAVAALIAATSTPARGEGWVPRSTTGSLSTVTLVDVSRLPAELLATVLPGARDGLVFLFLIVKLPAAKGVPTVSELRDFDIDHASYQGRSAKQLGKQIEPVVFMEEVNDFLARVDRSFSGRSPAAPGEAYIMVATIGGATLPERASGEIALEIGFGGAIERMPFSFTVPAAPEPGSEVVPAVPGDPAVEGDSLVPI